MPASINSWSAEYLDSLYQQFRLDPESVPEDVRAFLQGFDLALSKEGEAALTAGPGAGGASPFQSGVDELINAYRESGHLCAQIDPFGRERERPNSLHLSHYGLTEQDLNRRVEASLKAGSTSGTLREILAHLEATYCRTIGLEFMHIRSDAEREWFLKNFEQRRGMRTLTKEERIRVMEQLARAEGFEGFCHRRYPSEKRFSLEGGVSLIPLMDAAIERASDLGAESMVIGMAHRGRLNVLNNILGKTYEQIFTEFEDNWEAGFADGGGDVKYHRGYSGERKLSNGKVMHLAMPSNPSHLESVNPLVLGRVRAKQRMKNDVEKTRVVPVLLHGDAAIAGQGVVAECLNMSQLAGYTCGGCVHVVINNMIGFTTVPEDGRSSTYCTDVAKMVDCPVFHVNGEDPEACVAVARLAMEYRQAFKKDVFIDMYCYRKYGHNEQDEQSYTQPILASMIQARESTLTLYTRKLLDEGVIDQAGAEQFSEGFKALLDKAQEAAKKKPHDPTIDPGSARWKGMGNAYSHAPVDTAVSKETLQEICDALGKVPEGFEVNPKLAKLLDDRRNLVKNGKVSHADAEMLAFGSLLIEGVPLRLSGQDVRRGTFSQRHAVLRDVKTGQPYISLDHIRELGEWASDREPGTKGADGRTRQARFCVWDSPLSEYAVLGFDYGYSQADPNMLVLWEAQFGDFANGTQVIFDQYIASSEIKWERWSGLVVLLPHGYEGAGPEHSSCRIERFLLLCANDNMQVVNPTTGAQHFHLLRRQLKRNFRKPLIVPSPKSMLRTATSEIGEFTRGSFQELIDDGIASKNAKKIKRVVLCSGKFYFELNDRRILNKNEGVAIVRLEQLYPFHAEMAKKILSQYPKDAEIVWAQEEPRNAGAYLFVADQFREQLGINLRYIGRPASATPAVGSKKAHKHEQEDLVTAAVGPGPAVKDGSEKKNTGPTG